MSQITIPQMDIVEAIMLAVNEVSGSEGASLVDINSYVYCSLGRVISLEKLQWRLKYAVDKGLLTKLDNGKYTMKDKTQSPFEAAEDFKKHSNEIFEKFDIKDDTLKKTASRAKQAVKYVKSAINEGLCSKNVTKRNETKLTFKLQDADQDAYTDKRNVMVSKSEAASSSKEDANVTQSKVDDKYGIKEKLQMDFIEAILIAVNEVNNSEGASVFDIKSYLYTNLNKWTSLEMLEWKLKYALDKGLLTKLGNGKYIIRDTSRSPSEVAEDLRRVRQEIVKEFDTKDITSRIKQEIKKVQSSPGECICLEKSTGKSETKETVSLEVGAKDDDQKVDTDKHTTEETENIGTQLSKEETKASQHEDDAKDNIKDKSATNNK